MEQEGGIETSALADFPKRPALLRGELKLFVIAGVVATAFGVLALWGAINAVERAYWSGRLLVSMIFVIWMVRLGLKHFRRKLVRRALDPNGGMVCPRCLFSLKALPDVGRCPECGMAYTRAKVISLWEETHSIRGRYERVLPPKATDADEPKAELARRAPWASWSLAGAIASLEIVARKHGFSGGRFQSYLGDLGNVPSSRQRSLPDDIFSLLQWLDSNMWSWFVVTNCAEGEDREVDKPASIAGLWEGEEGTSESHAFVPPIMLLRPMDIKGFKLAELAAERREVRQFAESIQKLNRDSMWMDCQLAEFAATKDGRILYIVTGAGDTPRGSVVVFVEGCEDRIWLADSLSQWILRMADCDGMEPALFPHTRDKIDSTLLKFFDDEFMVKNPNLNVAGLAPFGSNRTTGSSQV